MPISIPGVMSQCCTDGRFGTVIELDDGSFGLVDYKASEAREEHIAFDSRLRTADADALENPAPIALGLSPFSRMGPLIIPPDRLEQNPKDEMVSVNQRTWMGVPLDDEAFPDLPGAAVAVRDAPAPPSPSKNGGL